MPTMTMNLEGDGAFKDLDHKRDRVIDFQGTIQVVALEKGMASGKPSVCFRFDLPDGRTLLAQSSARLFVMAAAGIVGKWPDVDDGALLAHIEKGKAHISFMGENPVEVERQRCLNIVESIAANILPGDTPKAILEATSRAIRGT